MEYLLGSLVTLLASSIVYRYVSSQKEYQSRINVQYRQSYNFSLIQPWASLAMPRKDLITQSTKFSDKNSTRVVISNDTAYWIFNNQLLQADVIDGKVDGNTTQTVDTMGLDAVELDNLAFIVDKLTEGKNDEGSNPRD